MNGKSGTAKPRLAVVGCGYWGRHLIRNLYTLSGVQLTAVCDFDLPALARIKRRYPAVSLQLDYDDLLADTRIDGVVIATPISTHFSFARKALSAGKHVLVENPVATSGTQALELLELAEKQRKTLMVDHTFLYTGAIREIRSLIDSGEMGELLYFDSSRISLGLVQTDTNVLWDLGAHDFAIMNYLCDRDPVSISAIGVKHLECPFETMAYVSVRFDNHVIAHFHLNWLSPVKVRKILLGGSKKMVVYDDLETSDKVKLYNSRVGVYHDPMNREQLLTGYQNGDMVSPNLDTTEPLRLVATEFARSIVERRPALSDGYAGYRVVRLLELAQRSMVENGRFVDLRSPAMSSKGAGLSASKSQQCLIPT